MSSLNINVMASEIKILEAKTPTLIEVEEYLIQCQTLSQEEKAIVYSWFMPKPVIKDRELPELLKVDNSENNLQTMVNAWRSEQYHRYIKHLFVAFVLNNGTVHRISDRNGENLICCLTAKPLLGLNDPGCNSDNVGITNSAKGQTDQVISLEAAYMIGFLYNFLSALDPDFMSKR